MAGLYFLSPLWYWVRLGMFTTESHKVFLSSCFQELLFFMWYWARCPPPPSMPGSDGGGVVWRGQGSVWKSSEFGLSCGQCWVPADWHPPAKSGLANTRSVSFTRCRSAQICCPWPWKVASGYKTPIWTPLLWGPVCDSVTLAGLYLKLPLTVRRQLILQKTLTLSSNF